MKPSFLNLVVARLALVQIRRNAARARAAGDGVRIHRHRTGERHHSPGHADAGRVLLRASELEMLHASGDASYSAAAP
jgi:hypothetical protein